MKIFALGQFTPIKSLKKTAKMLAITLPLTIGAESCSPWLFPPPPPCYPHRHHPRPLPPRLCPPYPHYHVYPFGLFGMTQAQDSIQYTDVFELNKNELAYIDNTKQNK